MSLLKKLSSLTLLKVKKMFKAITSSLPENLLVLAYFYFPRSETFHVAKTYVYLDDNGKVVDYMFEDGNKLNISGLPSHYVEIPDEASFIELKSDLSNAPLGSDVLIKFEDGSIENAFFERSEDGDIIYCLFDGEVLTHNPTHYCVMPKLPE